MRIRVDHYVGWADQTWDRRTVQMDLSSQDRALYDQEQMERLLAGHYQSNERKFGKPVAFVSYLCWTDPDEDDDAQL